MAHIVAPTANPRIAVCLYCTMFSQYKMDDKANQSQTFSIELFRTEDWNIYLQLKKSCVLSQNLVKIAFLLLMPFLG